MGAMAGSWGGLQRRGEPGRGLRGCAAPGTQQGLQTPARGSGSPFPSEVGVCSPVETHSDLCPWRGKSGVPAAPMAIRPTHLLVLGMEKHPAPPHGCRQPARCSPPARRENPGLGGAPPRGWGMLPAQVGGCCPPGLGDDPPWGWGMIPAQGGGCFPPGLGDAPPWGWGMLPAQGGGCSSLGLGDAPCTGLGDAPPWACCKRPPIACTSQAPGEPLLLRTAPKGKMGSPSPRTPSRRPSPGPAGAPAVPGAPARAAGTCSSGGP